MKYKIRNIYKFKHIFLFSIMLGLMWLNRKWENHLNSAVYIDIWWLKCQTVNISNMKTHNNSVISDFKLIKDQVKLFVNLYNACVKRRPHLCCCIMSFFSYVKSSHSFYSQVWSCIRIITSAKTVYDSVYGHCKCKYKGEGCVCMDCVFTSHVTLK